MRMQLTPAGTTLFAAPPDLAEQPAQVTVHQGVRERANVSPVEDGDAGLVQSAVHGIVPERLPEALETDFVQRFRVRNVDVAIGRMDHDWSAVEPLGDAGEMDAYREGRYDLTLLGPTSFGSA